MLKSLFLKPILIYMLVGSAIFAQAQTFLNPPLNNQKEQIHFLLYLNREIPDLFSQAIEYPTGLLTLLTDYRNLMGNLKQQPVLSKIANQYNTRYKIAIYDSNQKENIIETEENQIQLIHVPEEILMDFIGLININSLNLSTGLISVLPAEKKQTAFQLSLENRIAFLRENLPEDIVGAGFKTQNLNISEVEITKGKLLDLIEVSYKKEWNMTNWIRTQVEQDPEINYNVIKESLLKQIGAKESVKRIDATLKRYFPKDLKNTEDSVAHKKNPTLVLEEVPVELALHRGFPSCDCSTQYSGLYAALPTERTFWIKRKEKIIGVVTGTIMSVEKKPSFYLHTINGPQIALSDLPLILMGMTQWMDKNKLNALVLPTSIQRYRIINRKDIREKIGLITDSEKTVEIEHIDKTLRSEIDKLYTKTYDVAEQNSQGFLLPKTKINNSHVQIEVEPIQYHYQLKGKIKILEIMTLSLALQKAQLDTSAQAVLKTFNLNSSDVKHFNDILLNVKKHNTAFFLKNLEDAAKELGITEDPKWMEAIRGQIELGRMRAPDAFNEENQKETFGVILRKLKKGTGSDFDIAAEVIKANTVTAGLISENPFTRYMLKLLTGDNSSYLLFESIISKINAFNGFVWKTYFFKQIVYDGNNEKYEAIVSNFRANKVSFVWNSSDRLSLLEAIKMPIVLAQLQIKTEKLQDIYRVNSLSDLSFESKNTLFLGLLNNESLLNSVDMHDISYLAESIYPMNSNGKKELFKKISELASKAHSAAAKSKIMEVFSYRLQREQGIDWDAIQQIKKLSVSIPLNIGMIRGNMNKVTSLSDFIRLLESGVSNPTKEYSQAINEVWVEFSSKFASFNPTLQVIENYKNMSKTVSLSIALIRSNLRPLNPNIKTAADFIKLLGPGVDNPNEAYNKQLSELWKEYAELFASLKPTMTEINQAKNQKHLIGGRLAIMTANLKSSNPNINTAADFIKLLEPAVEDPSEDYKRGISNLWIEYAELFASLKPTMTEINQAKNQKHLIDGRLAIMAANLKSSNPNIRTADDFMKLLEPAVENPSKDYEKSINSLWIEYADRFANLNPTIFQINAMKKSKVIYVDGLIAIIKANLKHVRTEKDYKMLLDPHITPSKAYFEALEKLKNESQGILNKVRSQQGQTSFYQGKTAYLFGKMASLWSNLSKDEKVIHNDSDAIESAKSCQNIFRK